MLGIEATGKLLSAVTRDALIRFSMSFLQKLYAPLSISFRSMANHAKNDCALKTGATRELLFDFGRDLQMRSVFNMMLQTRNRSIFLALFLTTSLFLLHWLYSILAEGRRKTDGTGSPSTTTPRATQSASACTRQTS